MARSMSDNEKHSAHETEPAHNEQDALLAVEVEPAVLAALHEDLGRVEIDAAEAVAVAEALEAADAVEAALPPAMPDQLPGELLAARREEMRLSVEEVSSRLKLASRQILALEANDFAQLPGMATVRGFIRSYARLLELDPEPLIAMVATRQDPTVDSIVARRPLPSPGFSGRRYSPPVRHRSAARRLTGLAVVILLFVGTLVYIAYRHDAVRLPDIDVASSISAITSSVLSTDTASAPEAPAPVEVVLPAATLSPETALQLKANQDAWVEVIAVDGERKLVSKLMKAGTSELVAITEPVVLVVGNAAGIEASLRGHSLNLRAAARDNVAKLSLK